MENRAAFFLPPEGLDAPRESTSVCFVTYPPLKPYISHIAEKYMSDGLAEEFFSPLRPDLPEAVITPSAVISAQADMSLIPGIECQYISLCPPLKEVDDGLFYTVKLLRHERDENIKAASELWRANAALMSHASRLMAAYVPEEKLLKRAAGIISREIPKKEGVGRLKKRYIDAVTPSGYSRLYSTVTAAAERIYDIQDCALLGGPMLKYIAETAASRGYDCWVCPSPMEDRLLHVVIPELSLAFVTSDRRAAYKGDAHRRVRLDGYLMSASKEDKAACRSVQKPCRSIEAEVCRLLAKAAALDRKIDDIVEPLIDMKAFKKQLGAYK